MSWNSCASSTPIAGSALRRETVTQWMTAAGLEPSAPQELCRRQPEGKIAVSLWLARDARALMATAARARWRDEHRDASRFVAAARRRRIRVSFEFFPPKTAEMEKTLWEAIERLAPLAPNFVSVTYGAGGSTRERTHATVKRILAETTLTPAAHLTCVAATRAEVDAVVRDYCDAGVRHIVALRGDPVGGAGARYAPHPGGYQNAADLVAGIKRDRRFRGFGLGLSGEASRQPDRRRRHRHAQGQGRCRRDARHHPVLLRERSLFPLSRSRARARHRHPDRAGHPAGAELQADDELRRALRRLVPAWLAERFDGLDDDAATRKLIAAAVAAEQVLDLVDRGVTDFHFYTMNRADLVYAICHLLGLRPAVAPAA